MNVIDRIESMYVIHNVSEELGDTIDSTGTIYNVHRNQKCLGYYGVTSAFLRCEFSVLISVHIVTSVWCRS